MREFTAEERALLERAREAAQRAYCPYSNFPVGAAVETEAGIFAGCNIENASYGLAICAERVALFAAIAAGAKEMKRLALACVRSGPDDPPGSRMPCGACRQVMAELMAPEATVLVEGAGVWRVADLLPEPFQLAERPFLRARETQRENLS
ncbi:MAG TPA: cytidine deaminase [Chthonomonadaceae bacterium]|nr:cytidine deaminase [Chthonomonadaceae bacterium]